MTTSLFASLVAMAGVAVLASSASAGLAEWQAEVASGTPAGYTNANIASPIVADIGVYSEASGGGVSYEFIVNATNDGVSSALIGTFANPPAIGDRAALKWEQWMDTGVYGTTIFGVVDNLSTVANTPGVDTHVVFVNNGTDTSLYVNGALADSIAGTPTIAGVVGIGQVHNPAGAALDPLTGTIIGVAVYDAALGPDEIAAHARAYVIPEPGSALLLLSAAGCLPWRRRANRSVP